MNRAERPYRTLLSRIPLALGLLTVFATGLAAAADLSFEERVRAQEAIQRVYYSHQLNTTLPFEEAFPREVLEKQVRDYLQKSAALDLFWKTPVTPEALRAELERISRSSRFPERLEEIYAALDHDALLVEECFARPSLVDRLVRSFFSTDQRAHAAARSQAEALRNRLLSGDLSINAPESHRTVRDVADAPTVDGAEAPPAAAANSPAGALSHDELVRWRAALPAQAEEIGPVLERDEGFIIQVVLSESQDRVKVATYTVPKKSWSSWWEESRRRFPEDGVSAVASRADTLPPATGKAPEFPEASAGGVSTQSTNCLQASWDNGSLDDIPSPRGRHTAVWTGTLMIVWGGGVPAPFSIGSEVYNTGGRYDPLTDTWSPTSTLNAPVARAQHSAIWTGSEMIIWGGTRVVDQSDQAVATGGRYNPATDTWTSTSTTGTPSAQYRHTALWTGSQMIIWGGFESSGVPNQVGGRYVPATDSWVPMTMSPGFFRQDYSAVWTGAEMLVWGGYNNQPVNTGIKYNPATDTWSSFGAASPPEARYQHGAVWTGSRMIIWGGKNAAGSNLVTGSRYNPANDTWTPTSTTNAPTGLRPSSVWTGSRMLTWTGNGLQFRGYDPVGDAWSFTAFVNLNQTFDSVVWTGARMIVWGGLLGGSNPLDTGWRYDVASDSWTPTSALNPLSAREGHSAVWTGNLMIIWGGRTTGFAATQIQTGARYDPLTDSWTPISEINSPFARSGHSAVWTGTTMVIWGSGTVASNDGGRYNLSTDTWLSTSTAQAPAARKGSTAVWTGSRMLVWGGVDASGISLNTGGKYDPSTNTWTGMTTVNAASPRSLHSAVWTGSRMIVWGGKDSSNNLDTGGLYDPVADSWSATSAANAPFRRYLHSAVWTGSEMIVWGGNDTIAGSLYTGGRYNPASSTWTPISTVGAPLSRAEHTAIWTGSEMVVWGGSLTNPLFTSTNALRSGGGRYNPATDTWKGLPLAGSPSTRKGHTAIWTGTHMIVWGGTHSGQERSGGRLRFDVLPDVDADQDGFTSCSGDCNDSDPAVHPGAVETCNGIDDDCAVAVDNGFDQDGDGFTSCGGDCNDANPGVNPGAPEICDHIDENCNNALDDGYADADGDGWAVCLDCDDADFHVYPGATETCNGRDDDCDLTIDEGGDALCDTGPTDCFRWTCGGTQGCVFGYQSVGFSCNDSNGCTQTDTCNGTGTCIGSNPVVCTPLDACHDAGTCSPSSGCSNPAKPLGASCEDGNSCTMGETCNILGVCGGGQPTDYDFDGHSPPACGGDDCDDLTGNVWASPQEVTNLTLTTSSPANPTWNSQAVEAGWGTNYDLTSGTLNGSGGLNSASATCLLSGSMSTNYNDSRPDPAPGSGFWYLTRAKNSCGVGIYGFASNSVERAIPACP